MTASSSSPSRASGAKNASVAFNAAAATDGLASSRHSLRKKKKRLWVPARRE